MIDRTIESDVLVIGGGGGGLRAAVAAHDEGARVLILSKGIVGKSGLTQTAVTGFQVAFGYADPRDNAVVHYADTIRGGYGLADSELARIFTAEAVEAVDDIDFFIGILSNVSAPEVTCDRVPAKSPHISKTVGIYLIPCT